MFRRMAGERFDGVIGVHPGEGFAPPAADTRTCRHRRLSTQHARQPWHIVATGQHAGQQRFLHQIVRFVGTTAQAQRLRTQGAV